MIAEPWNYPDDLVSEIITETTNTNAVRPGGASSGVENERFVDLSKGPPPYEGNSAQYIAKIKEELGLQVDKVCVKIFHVLVIKRWIRLCLLEFLSVMHLFVDYLLFNCTA